MCVYIDEHLLSEKERVHLEIIDQSLPAQKTPRTTAPMKVSVGGDKTGPDPLCATISDEPIDNKLPPPLKIRPRPRCRILPPSTFDRLFSIVRDGRYLFGVAELIAILVGFKRTALSPFGVIGGGRIHSSSP